MISYTLATATGRLKQGIKNKALSLRIMVLLGVYDKKNLYFKLRLKRAQTHEYAYQLLFD